MSDSRRRKSLERVARSRRTERWRATSGWSTTVTPVIGGDAIACARMAEPSRNVELKAHDADPGRTLERALAVGAEDRGKLRQEQPGGATLIAYERPDAASERVSSYRLVPVSEPEPLREALAAADGVL